MDRYQDALASSAVLSNDAAVAEEVKKIVSHSAKYETEETYRFLFSSIDLTTLSTEDSQRSVAAFTQRVNDFDNDHPDIKNVAAICVYSNFAEVVKANLDVPGVDIRSSRRRCTSSSWGSIFSSGDRSGRRLRATVS